MRAVSTNRTARTEKSIGATTVQINFLKTRRLKTPLSVVVEPDGGEFIARSVDLPLYGAGEDLLGAIRALKSDIEALHEELLEDDNFSEEWLRYKSFLQEIIE
ncbi:MAG: hypothetical protein A4E69_01044 [Syntrophus sp. PtaB.Bin138]|nr:hypothetical protein [Geobacteraceae bacterium]OPY14661.1 MAG: hypothetical protein A4E69_01044 [Syntrophus sp. PtaB.Bin138]